MSNVQLIKQAKLILLWIYRSAHSWLFIYTQLRGVCRCAQISIMSALSVSIRNVLISRAAWGEVGQRKYGMSTCQCVFARDMNRREASPTKNSDGSRKPLTWQGVNRSIEVRAKPAPSLRASFKFHIIKAGFWWPDAGRRLMSALPGLIFDSGFGRIRGGGAYFMGTDLLFAWQRVGREWSVMHVMGNISNSVRLIWAQG
jgi:hypothetical protein